MANSAQTIGHIMWVKYDSDGNPIGINVPHAYTLPNRPRPIKAT